MNRSSVELLNSKEHLKIDFDNDGRYIIEFRLNTGKGTSPIRIPIEFMGQVIDILEDGPKEVEEKNIADIIRNSLAYDLDENGQEVVVFRTRYGRGSKIHKIPKNEYGLVIQALRRINKDIPEVIAKYEDPNY